MLTEKWIDKTMKTLCFACRLLIAYVFIGSLLMGMGICLEQKSCIPWSPYHFQGIEKCLAYTKHYLLFLIASTSPYSAYKYAYITI